MSKTPPKRKPGRPRTRPMPKDLVKLRLDVTKDEAARARKAAEVADESLSTFARKAVVWRTAAVLNRSK